MQTFSLEESDSCVWQVRLQWVFAYILTNGKEWTLVDSGTRWDRIRLLQAVRALKLRLRDCHSVLLTHGHCDHSGNAAFFARCHQAPLHAHVAERIYIETPRTYIPRGLRAISRQGTMFALGEVVWPVRRCEVDVVLHEGDVVHTPAGEWRVLHTPGHTPGHISYFREHDGVLLLGDAIINIVPYKRIEGLTLPLPIFSVDVEQGRESACRLIELAPRVLLPGHGRPIVRNTAARLHEFLCSTPE